MRLGPGAVRRRSSRRAGSPRASSSRVGRAPVAVDQRRARPGSGRDLRARTAPAAVVGVHGATGVVPLVQRAGRARRSSSTSMLDRRGRSGSATTAASSRTQPLRERARRWRGRTGRRCTRAQPAMPSPSPSLDDVERSGRTSPCAAPSGFAAGASSPASSRRVPRRGRQVARPSPGTAGAGPASAAGLSASTSRSNGTSWWAKAARSVSRTRASSSPERGVAGQVGAQHQGVDEEADQVVERVVGAAGDRGAERDVGARAEPGSSAATRGLHDHEHADVRWRGPAPRRPRCELGVERRTSPVPPRWPLSAGRGRSAGSVELLGQAGQRLAPVRELARGEAAGSLRSPSSVALPAARSRRTAPAAAPARARARRAGPRRRRRRSPQQRPRRPAVGGDVVHHQQQHVLVVGASRNSAARSGGLGGRGRSACPAAAASRPAELALVDRLDRQRRPGRRGVEHHAGRRARPRSGKTVRSASCRATTSPSAAAARRRRARRSAARPSGML